MNIVVVGDGKVGSAITRMLAEEHHDVVIIDNSERALQQSSNSLDVMTICGNGVNHDIQIEAGVPEADLLIAATSMDETNILCCLIAKKLGAKNTIARIRNPQYHDQLVFLQEELGLSMSINPEQAAAREISKLLRYRAAVKVDLFAGGRVEMVELKVQEGGPLDGIVLVDLYKTHGVRILVTAVRRGDAVFIPDGNFRLQAKDMITISAVPKDMERFWSAIGEGNRKLRRVMIVGGGHIAHYLSRMLLDLNIEVRIIEKNPQRCRELCEFLPGALIIEGNGTNHELLLEEGLEHCDAFIGLTGIDEENIILALYAAAKKAGKVIAKVNNSDLLDLVSNAGVDSIISPKEITADHIVRYVRAMQNSVGSVVETLYRIAGGTCEALEFLVKSGSQVTGVKLKSLLIQKGILVAGIARGRSAFVPSGNDIIEAGDRVIVVTNQRCFDDIEDILM